MKHLQKFEELDPSTYRNLKDRTGDYAFSQYKANTPEMKARANKMGRINQLSGERFEQEFFNQFPQGTKIKVYDSLNPSNKVELELNSIAWRANWTYYDLDFKQPNSDYYGGNYDVHIRFKGDTAMRGQGDAYSMDSGGKLGFKGDIMIDDSSKQLINSMFQFGVNVKVEEPTAPIEEPVEEKPKGFISRVKNYFTF
jgi:hypothetical protein